MKAFPNMVLDFFSHPIFFAAHFGGTRVSLEPASNWDMVKISTGTAKLEDAEGISSSA